MSRIVMTGTTTGIGRVAAGHLLARKDVHLVTGIRATGIAPTGAETHALDLASLASVRAFAEAVGGSPIDALVLNAGGQRPSADERSADGHELTFAVNHLAHVLLLHLLLPDLAPDARVVITSSGTHDPAERTGVPPPHHADVAKLADPRCDPLLDQKPLVAGMRAYSASKLCNLLTARALAARKPGLTVIAYDPGLTPGTGLARDHGWLVRKLIWPLLPLLQPFQPGMNSLADAGKMLAELATETEPPAGHIYAALRKGRITWPAPSALAQDDPIADTLWDDSAAMVGAGA